jgi:SET domain-containing protein
MIQNKKFKLPKRFQNENIIVKKSLIKGAGFGVFATRTLPANTHLGIYRGDKCTQNDDGDYVLDVSIHHQYKNGKTKLVKLCVNAENKKTSNWTRFINSVTSNKHDKNVEFYIFGSEGKEKIGVYTTQKILKGKELLLDYGNEYF